MLSNIYLKLYYFNPEKKKNIRFKRFEFLCGTICLEEKRKASKKIKEEISENNMGLTIYMCQLKNSLHSLKNIKFVADYFLWYIH